MEVNLSSLLCEDADSPPPPIKQIEESGYELNWTDENKKQLTILHTQMQVKGIRMTFMDAKYFVIDVCTWMFRILHIWWENKIPCTRWPVVADVTILSDVETQSFIARKVPIMNIVCGRRMIPIDKIYSMMQNMKVDIENDPTLICNPKFLQFIATNYTDE